MCSVEECTSTQLHPNWIHWMVNFKSGPGPFDADKYVKYCVCQLEKGEQGTLHLQGYVELHDAKTLKWLKLNFSWDAHFEPRKGTAQQARDYCRKDDTRQSGPWEFGEWTPIRQGQRTDIQVCWHCGHYAKCLTVYYKCFQIHYTCLLCGGTWWAEIGAKH